MRNAPGKNLTCARGCGLLGAPTSAPRAQTKGTRDGKGIVFIAHDGDIYPSGFPPVTLGNVTCNSLVDVYRDSLLLQQIRSARFHGRFRGCDYTDSCGGSRARAYARTGDPLGEDPACAYDPRDCLAPSAGPNTSQLISPGRLS